MFVAAESTRGQDRSGRSCEVQRLRLMFDYILTAR